MEYDGQILKCIPQPKWRASYGRHVVSAGIFEWRLNLTHASSSGVHVGVIHADVCANHVDDPSFVSDGNGVMWGSETGCLLTNNWDFPKVTKSIEGEINDMPLSIKIDIDERCLYYSIDNEEYQKAPYELKQGKSFRLAVAFPRGDGKGEQECVEFL